MGQFYSGADLKRGALQRAGEPTDGSSAYDALCMKYINELYFDILAGSSEFDVDTGDAWLWAKSPDPIILTLQPEYTDGTVSVTQNSTAGSFSIAPITSMAGQYLAVDDGSNSERYRILTHVAGAQAFVLDGPYTAVTNSLASFRVLQIVYPIKNERELMRLVEPFRVYKTTFDEDRNYQIYGLDSSSFNRDYPLAAIVSGMPNRFFHFKDDNDVISVRFNMVPSELTRVEIDWVPMMDELIDSDSSVPIIPRSFRKILEYGATFFIMTDKNDDRAEKYFALTKAKLLAMREHSRKEQSQINTKSKGYVFARQENIRVRQRLQLFVRQGYYG